MSDTELIAATREILGLAGWGGLRRLSEVVGVDEQTVHRWQTGRSPIRNTEDRAWLEALVALYAERPALRKGLIRHPLPEPDSVVRLR